MRDNRILKFVGQRIRELRKMHGLTQEQLAEKVGLNYTYIGSVERAEKNISLVNLERITNALGVSLYELFIYERHKSVINSEKDRIIADINVCLVKMNPEELRKLLMFIKEFM